MIDSQQHSVTAATGISQLNCLKYAPLITRDPRSGEIFLTMAVVLKFPVEVEGDWEYNWFDPAHRHSLLLNESYFYILSYEENHPVPKLFYHEVKLPSKLILGKISLDMKLISLQINLTSILVIDTSKKRKWAIDIRYPSDNYILPFGIVWSDHGGNSQDLVIATNKGLELYKISEVRGQCKLSRTISQPASAFWYEPSHRVMLLAMQRKVSALDHVSGANRKEILLMDGFFFKTEKAGSSIPQLELPPPDKIPHFELGPGVMSEDIALVAIYGRVLCLVRYTDGDVGSDFITVYQLTKQRVERLHYLSLKIRTTGGLRFSVYDNLLLCHCLAERQTLVFDVLSAPVKTGSGSAIEVVLPLLAPAPMHRAHALICKQENENKRIAATAGTPVGANGISGVAEAGTISKPVTSIANAEAGDTSGKPADVTADGELDRAAEWGPPVTTPSPASKLFELRLRAGGPPDASIRSFGSLTFVGAISRPPDNGGWGCGASPHGWGFSGGNGAGGSSGGGGGGFTQRDSSFSLASSAAGSARTLHEELDEPEPAMAVYNCSNRSGGGSASLYEFFYPFWLADVSNGEMWRIECDFDQIFRSMRMISDTKEAVGFLCRRGQQFGPLRNAAGDKLLDYQFVNVHGRLAKQLLLCSLLDAVVDQQELSILEELYAALMRPYITEARRLTLLQLAAGDPEGSMSVLPPLPPAVPGYLTPPPLQHTQPLLLRHSSSTSAAMLARTRSVTTGGDTSTNTTSASADYAAGYTGSRRFSRLSISAVNAFSGATGANGGMGVSTMSGLSLAAAGDIVDAESGAGGSADLRARMDCDPLEPASPMQLFLPDIAMFGVRARKLQYLSARMYGSGNGGAGSIRPSSAVCSPTSAGSRTPNPHANAIMTSKSVISISSHNYASNGGGAHRSGKEGLFSSDLEARDRTGSMGFTVQPTCQSLPLTTRRDAYGHLISTQSEVISHIWLPVLLNSEVDLDYCAKALSSFVVMLREYDVDVVPPLAILLMNVLFHCHKYTKLSQLMRLKFFPDAAEVAMTALEFSDMLQDHINNLIRKRLARAFAESAVHVSAGAAAETANTSATEEGRARERVRVSGAQSVHEEVLQFTETAQRVLQQASIDMLFRLNELVVIVKWYLNHGFILEAIAMCKRKQGYWKPGLFPGCVSGTEFFLGAVGALKVAHKEFEDYVAAASPPQTLAPRPPPSSSPSPPAVATVSRQFATVPHTSGTISDYGDESLFIPKDITAEECNTSLQDARNALFDRSAELLYLVFCFIREWDPSVLAIYMVSK